MYDVPEVAQLLELAEVAAATAANFLLHDRPAELRIDAKSTATDAVTAMDRGSEEMLVQLLLAERPQDGILGEEGAQRQSTSGVRWIIDPLDGTVNYLYGIPEWAVCVAAEYQGEVIAGVVHAPALGAVWTAAAGMGAAKRVGTQPATSLRVGTEDRLTHALVGTGFGYDSHRRLAQVAALSHVIGEVRDIRRAGAASVDLCRVSDGTYDGYFEMGLSPWDHSAAGVVVTEAGGRIGGLPGDPVGDRMAIAANPALFEQLQQRVAIGMAFAGL